MRYAISDVHGKYDLLLKLLDTIHFSNEDILYILGDVVDGVKDNLRNPKDIECLEYIMKRDNIKMVLGNHEYDLLEFLDDNFIHKLQKYTFTDKVKVYLENNSEIDLIKDYLYSGFYRYLILPTNTLKRIHQYLRRLPFYILSDGYILCHGGIEIPYEDISIEKVLKIQEKYNVIWLRDEFYYNTNKIKNTKVIFGHTPTNAIQKNCTRIWINKSQDKIGIDTSFFDIPTLACINLDNLSQVYYIT